MDKEKLAEVIKQAVDDVKVVDVHTHLFPSSHGDLMLFGIDELRTFPTCDISHITLCFYLHLFLSELPLHRL